MLIPQQCEQISPPAHKAPVQLAGWQAVLHASTAGSEISHLPSRSATSPADQQSERGVNPHGHNLIYNNAASSGSNIDAWVTPNYFAQKI